MTLMNTSRLSALACMLSLTVNGAVIAEEAPLPEPLTLEYALSLADEAHPDLEALRKVLELRFGLGFALTF